MIQDAVASKEKLTQLVSALRELHRALVQIARSQFERDQGPVNGAGHLLQLLTQDPAFAWLHELSEVMVSLDEILEDNTVSVADARAIRLQIETLVAVPSADMTEFSQKYSAALTDPAVVMAHAHVRQALSAIE